MTLNKISYLVYVGAWRSAAAAACRAHALAARLRRCYSRPTLRPWTHWHSRHWIPKTHNYFYKQSETGQTALIRHRAQYRNFDKRAVMAIFFSLGKGICVFPGGGKICALIAVDPSHNLD